MQLIPSTILWKGNLSYDIYLTADDTRKLVEAFINGTSDVVNVQMHPDGGPACFFMHIDVQQIKAIIEGYIAPKRK